MNERLTKIETDVAELKDGQREIFDKFYGR